MAPPQAEERTFGPAIAILPLPERWQGPFAELLSVFGRAPMFYTKLHLFLIHGLTIFCGLGDDGREGTHVRKSSLKYLTAGKRL